MTFTIPGVVDGPNEKGPDADAEGLVDQVSRTGEDGPLAGGCALGIFLLIVAGLVGWFFWSAISRGNRRMAYSDQKDAEREMKGLVGEPQLMPTWAMKPGRLREFMARVEMTLRAREVPAEFIETVLADDLEYHQIMHFVALLERRNGGFTAQVTAAADYVFDKWVAHEYRKVGLPTWGRSRSDVDKFVTDVSVASKERSVAPPFFKSLMEDPGAIEKMMRAVAESEGEGASRADQVQVAAQIVTEHWADLPKEEQDRLWRQDFKDVLREASEATRSLRALTSKPTWT